MNPVTYRNGSQLPPAQRLRAHSPPKSSSRLQHDLSFLAPAGESQLVSHGEEAAGLKAAEDAARLPKQDARTRARIRTDVRTHAMQPVVSGHGPGPGPAAGKDRLKLSF